ncbi:MAG: hypothetical protein L0287_06130 [Anaerolineae bacterium]|nr:hypothetical protein [Anaerolineae bacterium]
MPTDDRITGLPPATAFKKNQLFPLVQDMETTPQTRKAELEELQQFLAPFNNNYLINGEFRFAQRQTPGTLTTFTQDKYSADRWRISRENADLQYQRVDGLAEVGLTSQYFGTWKKITNAGKCMVYQIIEGANSVPLRGKEITFQVKMKASAPKTIRMAIIELQNAGTIDTIPATFITAWGASGVDPTLGANLAIITGAESKAVTTAMQVFSVTVTVPANSKNLICAVWSNSQFSVNDTLSLAEAGLYVSATISPWVPRSFQQELTLCHRHYWKSFEVDTGPIQNIGLGHTHFRWMCVTAGATTSRAPSFFLPVEMFKEPTAVTYNPSAANGEVRDTVVPGDCSATAVTVTAKGFNLSCTGNAASVAGNPHSVHISLEAEL